MSQRGVMTLAVAAGAALVASPAIAQTATDQFEVSITVESECEIEVNDLSFGTVSDLTPAIGAGTTGTVTCFGIHPVSISFDPGTGGTSTFATRQMELTGETIDYNIYADPAHTEILGDGTGGTVTIDFTSTGSPDPFDVFGLTDEDQNPKPPGTYTSTITATVTF